MDQTVMESTGPGTYPKHIFCVQKQYFRSFRGNNVHLQRLSGKTGIVFSKGIANTDLIENSLIAPDIIVFHRYASGQDQSDGGDTFSAMVYNASSAIFFRDPLEAPIMVWISSGVIPRIRVVLD